MGNSSYNVQPLRTSDEINDFIEALSMSNYGARNVILFKIGVSSGLRISDIVRLTVADVFGKSSFTIVETKSRKKRTVHLSAIMPDVATYIESLPPDTVYLFESRKGGHITTTQGYRILTQAADLLGRADIGTHSMRKTFGYFHFKRFNDIGELMTILNHSSAADTLKYIGITDDSIGNNLKDFRLFD